MSGSSSGEAASRATSCDDRACGQEQTNRPDDARWLDDFEQLAWRPLATMMTEPRRALECQLERDAGLSFLDDHALGGLLP